MDLCVMDSNENTTWIRWLNILPADGTAVQLLWYQMKRCSIWWHFWETLYPRAQVLRACWTTMLESSRSVKSWGGNNICQGTRKRSSGSAISELIAGTHLSNISTCSILTPFLLLARTSFQDVKLMIAYCSLPLVDDDLVLVWQLKYYSWISTRSHQITLEILLGLTNSTSWQQFQDWKIVPFGQLSYGRSETWN